MGLEECDLITKVIKTNQDEFRNQFKAAQSENRLQFTELRSSTSEVARAVASLATTIARVEERHAQQNDGLKRIGTICDEHEQRLRVVERESGRANGHELRLKGLEQDYVNKDSMKDAVDKLNVLSDAVLSRTNAVMGGWKMLSIVAMFAAFFVATLISITK